VLNYKHGFEELGTRVWGVLRVFSRLASDLPQLRIEIQGDFARTAEAWTSVKEKTGMKNLFVGNMSFQTTEGDLRAIFEPFGQVARVHIAMDRETGRSRGFGFVEMPNDEEAAKAIAGLDGKPIGGRNLKVNEARPKSESTGPRGPRSGGGGDRGDRGDRGNRGRFSNEDYREAARQPREPRW
jgi:cold-inducible RNA-binding protein